jgi:drug/metabolite transporter (DMT)-like permease
MSSEASAAPARAEASPLYLLLTMAVASSFAAGHSLARLAYDGGSDPTAVNVVRILFAAGFLFVWMRLNGAAVRLPPAERWRAMLVGLVLAAYSWCMFAAFLLIPVGVAVVVFYLYPLLTALVQWGMGWERPSGLGIASVLLGFAGVALVVGAPAELPDWRGVALSFLAAVGFTIVLLVNSRTAKGRDTKPVTLHMLATAGLAFVAVCLVEGEIALPRTEIGIAAFVAIPAFYTFAMVMLWFSVAAVGPVRTALVMNLEPVVSLGLAWAILGQRLGPAQLFGAAVVLAAISLATIRPRP